MMANNLYLKKNPMSTKVNCISYEMPQYAFCFHTKIYLVNRNIFFLSEAFVNILIFCLVDFDVSTSILLFLGTHLKGEINIFCLKMLFWHLIESSTNSSLYMSSNRARNIYFIFVL